MQKNNTALLNLQIIKFMYDYIWKDTEESSWMSILYQVLHTNRLNNTSGSEERESFDISTRSLVKKVMIYLIEIPLIFLHNIPKKIIRVIILYLIFLVS